MTELFDVPESLSPYDRWLKRHRIVTLHVPPSDDMDNPEEWEQWRACQGDGSTESWVRQTALYLTGVGHTEEEAITSLCNTVHIVPHDVEELNKRKEAE